MLISADADGQGCFPEAVLQPESLFLLADIIVFQAQTQIFTMIVADINVRIFPLIFVEPDLKKTSAGCLVKALNEKSRGKKVKILQKILTEMLKHGVVDAFLDNLKKRKDSLGQKLNELELEIGNIAIDDLSIDAAE